MNRLLRVVRRPSRGQTLVEVALILPIFILLLMGIFDLGRAVYAGSTIENAAREAVREAIVNQTCADVGTVADAHAVSLGIAWNAGVGTPCTDAENEISILFLDAALDGTACAVPYQVGCYAQVTITYTYTAATPIIGNLVGAIDMQAVSTQPIEYECTTADTIEGTCPGTPLP